jgi:hypothetical protein
MGTVWSDVPWTISVGIVKAGMSDRKSVAEKARTQSMVAFGLAWSASPCSHRRISLDTEKVSGPAPKKVLPKPARKCGRSLLRPSTIWSNTLRSTPSGLSGVFRRKGVTAARSTAL